MENLELKIERLNDTIEKQSNLLFDAKQDVESLHQSMRRLAKRLHIMELQQQGLTVISEGVTT